MTLFHPRAFDDPRGRAAVRASVNTAVRRGYYVDRNWCACSCARSRANRVFGTDIKRIRTKYAVMDKNKSDLGWISSKIGECARTGRRPRKSCRRSVKFVTLPDCGAG